MIFPSLEALQTILKAHWDSPVATVNPDGWVKDLASEVREMIDGGNIETQEQVKGYILSAKEGSIDLESTMVYVDGSELVIIGVGNSVFSGKPGYFLIKPLPADIKRREAEERIPKNMGVARLMAVRQYRGR